MYELIILSVLIRGEVHGYVIAGVINDVIGPHARASNGRIYPLLAKLTDDGLIAVHNETTSRGGRLARRFAVSDTGRERFLQLMGDTTANPREYRDLFAFKVTAFDQIPRRERIRLLEHYQAFARDHAIHHEAQGLDIAQSETYGIAPSERRRFAAVFEHLVTVWNTEHRWATALLQAERSSRKS